VRSGVVVGLPDPKFGRPAHAIIEPEPDTDGQAPTARQIGEGDPERAGRCETQLRETQQMTLLLADGKEFQAFFARQVSTWGQVVRENNIKA